MTKYYVDKDGNYLGGFDGAEPPLESIEVPFPPDHAGMKWNVSEYKESTEQVKARILTNINELESSQYMSRGEREAWLVLMVSTANQQNVTEPQLYLANPFYKKIKDQDNHIKILRAQL